MGHSQPLLTQVIGDFYRDLGAVHTHGLSLQFLPPFLRCSFVDKDDLLLEGSLKVGRLWFIFD